MNTPDATALQQLGELYPALLKFVPEKSWLFDPEAVTGILV